MLTFAADEQAVHKDASRVMRRNTYISVDLTDGGGDSAAAILAGDGGAS